MSIIGNPHSIGTAGCDGDMRDSHCPTRGLLRSCNMVICRFNDAIVYVSAIHRPPGRNKTGVAFQLND